MVDALIRANKLHDLAILPGETHAATRRGSLFIDRMARRYLVEHLKP